MPGLIENDDGFQSARQTACRDVRDPSATARADPTRWRPSRRRIIRKVIWIAAFFTIESAVTSAPSTAGPEPTSPNAEVGADRLARDLAAAHLSRSASWTPVVTYGCNAVSFGSSPGLGNLYVGRMLNNTDPRDICSGYNWSLVLARMNWRDHKITYEKTILDTSKKPVVLADGNVIYSAYDATVALWRAELWIAFECYGEGPDFHGVASNCIGPLKNDLMVDTGRAIVVVKGGTVDDRDSYLYSAAVPKLLVYGDRLYLYWTAMQLRRSAVGHNFDFATDIGTLTTRGIQLGQGGAGKSLSAIDNSQRSVGHAIFANDPSSVEVFGLDPDDPMSNTAADLFQAVAVGSHIYVTEARGGSGCNTPHGTSAGCYRLTIGESTNPLGYHTFNNHLAPSNSLPDNPQEYYRFVYRPEDQKTALLGGNFVNPQNLPGVPSGIEATIWPTFLLSPEQLPAALAATVQRYNSQ